MIKFFRSVRFANDWELTIALNKLQFRFGRSQLACWWNYQPIYNLLLV